MSLGKCKVLGEEVRDRRRSIGQFQNETLAGKRRKPFAGKPCNGLRSQQDRHQDGDLDYLVRGEAQRAVVIDLTGGVGVGNRENACSQHKDDTENSQDRHPGKPGTPLCCHETHVIKDYSSKGTRSAKPSSFVP